MGKMPTKKHPASLNFVVHGDYITEYARNLYRESKDPKKGVNFLIRALVGFPADIAGQIVMGKKKLVGVNEVYVEDDDVDDFFNAFGFWGWISFFEFVDVLS